jgi:transposase-like protein
MQTDAAVAAFRPGHPGRRERTPRATAASAVLAALNGLAGTPAACPTCGGGRLQRWGFSGGLQRFRCVACHRCCNPLTGTPLARLRRRDLWLDHAQALHDGLSIRAAGRRLGLHHNTTFRWRHRWLLHPGAQRDDQLQGILEADIIDFVDVRTNCRAWRRVAIARPSATAPEPPPVSTPRPAAAVLAIRDRRGAMVDMVLGPADLITARATTVEQTLAGIVDRSGTVLCSNGSPIFHRVAQSLQISHHPLPRGPGGRLFNLDEVRGCGRRLERWMRRFRGVSTHYLVNYLGWRRILERNRLPLPRLAWLRLALGRQH